MSKKKNKKVSEGDENNELEESNKEENDANNEKKGGEDGGKKDGGGGGGGGKNAAVLKIDLHCEGCASKVVKRIRAFEGVVSVEVDGATNKLSVTGKVDPVKLRQELEEKLHKKVELISPVPKKGKDDGKSKDAAASGGGEGDDGKAEKKKDGNESNKSKKSDEKKEKEVTITTAVLKVPLHCEGCIQKINKIITKTKGYQEMKIDRQKDLVTVTGAIDMKALAESLKKHLKKDVEVVPPKKEEKKDKEKEKEKENEKEKEKGKGGGGGGAGAGAGGKGKGGGAGGGGGGGKGKGGVEGEDGGAEEGKTDQANKMQVQFGYGYPMMPYMPGAPYGPPRPAPPGAPYGPPGPPHGYDPYQFSVHAPQIFSDENPNACSIM